MENINFIFYFLICNALFTQAHFANKIISIQNTYRKIDASLREVMSSGQNNDRLRAINSSREERQTPHWQPQTKI